MKQIIRFLPMKELTEEMVDIFIKQINVFDHQMVYYNNNYLNKLSFSISSPFLLSE